MISAPDSLRVSWSAYRAATGARRSTAITENYANEFSQGFLLCDNSLPERDLLAHWPMINMGHSYVLKHAPGLRIAHAVDEVNDLEVLVVGVVFGASSVTHDGAAVARRVLGVLAPGVVEDQLWDYIETLSGRFVVFARRKSELLVVGDPMGSSGAYWHKSDSKVFVASHTGLIALAVGGLTSNECEWVMAHPEYKSPGGKALPALITPHDGVQEIIPNCYLSILASSVAHKRFFPRHPIRERSVEAAYEDFFESLRTETRRWLSLPEEPVLSLTSGSDSRTILAAGLDEFQKRNAVALTYHFFGSNAQTTHDDLMGANAIALRADLRHQVLDIGALESGTSMANLYRTTFPSWARFPTLTKSLYEQLPSSSSYFVAVGGEIGTGFYRQRDDNPVTPITMAAKYTTSKFKEDPKLIEHFEEYYEYVDFAAIQGSGYDPYDLFYWEHRLGKWASIRYAEYSLAATVALPMNSRRFINAMLSVPLSDRFNKSLYTRLFSESGM